MDTLGDRIRLLLDRVPTSVILWAMTVARAIMCVITYLALVSSKADADLSKSLEIQFYLWLGWTMTSLIAQLIAQPLPPKLLRLVVIGDAILALPAIMLLRGTDAAIIAFGISVSIIAMNIRLPGKWVVSYFAIFGAALLLRDMAPLRAIPGLVPQTVSHSIGDTLQMSLVLIMTLMLLIWGNRRSRLENFNNSFSSARTLSFEKSFDFNLQAWTDAFALLFGSRKAACVVCAPTRNASHQYYHCNLPIWQREQDRDELVTGLRNLPLGSGLFDIEHNQVVVPGTEITRPFDENEKRIARVLSRANIKGAFVQPMQIDRARGGILCVLDGSIDAITIAEATFIEQHVSDMTEYLGKVALAQRNFIADAHDVARRDLHDGVLQTLAALRMRLLMITKRENVAKNPVELEIRKAVDIITLEQSRLRGFLENSETADHTVNLVSQIDICARTVSLQWGIEVKLRSEEPAIPVDIESAFNIEHLLREIITNAVRHAKSNSLTVSLSLKQDALMMAVTDLSQPLDGAQIIEKSALTLKSASLRDRLRLVNGEAYAEGLGKGTLLSIRIPMQQIEND